VHGSSSSTHKNTTPTPKGSRRWRMHSRVYELPVACVRLRLPPMERVVVMMPVVQAGKLHSW